MYTVRFEFHGVASCLLVPNEKRVAHQPQVGNENPLDIFFYPKLYVGVEHFRPPQLPTSGGVSRHNVLVPTVTLC